MTNVKKGGKSKDKRAAEFLKYPQRLDVLPVVRFPENCDLDMLATVDPWTVWKNKKGGGGGRDPLQMEYGDI